MMLTVLYQQQVLLVGDSVRSPLSPQSIFQRYMFKKSRAQLVELFGIVSCEVSDIIFEIHRGISGFLLLSFKMLTYYIINVVILSILFILITSPINYGPLSIPHLLLVCKVFGSR